MTVAPHAIDTTESLGPLTLRVSLPGGPSRVVKLSSACCRIGSAESCTLTLLAPGVDAVHCEILREKHGSIVRHLGGETRLGGEEFTESPLAANDRLTVGPLEVEVLADEPARPLKEPARAAAELIAETQTSPRLDDPEEDANKEWPTRLAEMEGRLQDLAEALAAARDSWAGQRQQDAAWREQLQHWQAQRVAAEAEMRQRLQELAGVVREPLAVQAPRDQRPEVPASLLEEADGPEAVQPTPQKESADPAQASAASDARGEEESTFEAGSDDAPMSVAEVCGQFGVPVTPTEEPAAPMPPRLEPSPTPAANGPEEEEQAVNAYMAELLQRLQSGAPPVAPTWTPASPEADQEAAESFAPAHLPEAPMAEGEFVPRAQAPEASCDLTAMRVLANTSARKAIDSHERQSKAIDTQSRLIVAGIALVFSFVMMWFSAAGSTVATWSAQLALIVAIYWTGRYLMLTRPESLAKFRKKRKKKKAAGPTETPAPPPPAPADEAAPSSAEADGDLRPAPAAEPPPVHS